MKVESLRIDNVRPYSKNAKKHDKKQIQKVADSIKKFGWSQPLVVDKDNTLIIGHCRLEAAKMLGLEEAPALRMENLSEEEVKALRLADNKLNESEWDLDLALEDLGDLSDELFELTGFNKDLLLGYDKLEKIEETNKCPNCGFELSSIKK